MSALAAIGEGLAELAVSDDSAELGFGGDMANVCVMAARLGVETRLAGRVGADALGSQLLRFWEQEGVDVAAIRLDPQAPTGLYINEPQIGGGHRFTYWRTGSAGSRLEPGDLDDAFFEGVGIIVFSGVTLAISPSAARAVYYALEQSRRRGICVACILNHRPALGGDIQQLAHLTRCSDIVIASIEDLFAVFRAVDQTVLKTALGSRPSELVLTNGDGPAEVTTRDGVVRQSVPQVAVRNAAGAGDALGGAYLARRLLSDPPALSLAWGVAAATLSVQRSGCASSYPTEEAVSALVPKLLEGAQSAPP